MKKINGDLTFDEMSSVMSEILNGKNNDEDRRPDVFRQHDLQRAEAIDESRAISANEFINFLLVHNEYGPRTDNS